MRIFLYLIGITLANVLTASFAPMAFGAILIPAGTYLIGATFVLRDLVQQKHGRRTAYITIVCALLLSAISSYLLHDPMTIVIASSITFAIGETTDTEIYTRLRLPLHFKVLYSGLVGGLLDSVIFVVIGLSPIGANFVPWAAVPFAILGQLIVKFIMQGIGAYAFFKFIHEEEPVNAAAAE